MEALKHAEQLISTKLLSFKALFTLVKLEARLAGLSVAPLMLTFCMLFVVLMTSWLLISVLIAYSIFLFFNNMFTAILFIFLLHLIILSVLLKYLLFNLRSMSFEKTRAYFSQYKDMNDAR